jgi:hypothetical protein
MNPAAICRNSAKPNISASRVQSLDQNRPVRLGQHLAELHVHAPEKDGDDEPGRGPEATPVYLRPRHSLGTQ